jgi:hypothetical protein
MIGALTTMMPGTLVDPDAPAGSRLVTLGLEREALRDDWFVVSASMLDDITKESWAGVYVASITDILPCEGDLNGDALVDGADLSALLGSWGPCPDCAGDLDGDGIVDGADVAVLLSRWGTCW